MKKRKIQRTWQYTQPMYFTPTDDDLWDEVARSAGAIASIGLWPVSVTVKVVRVDRVLVNVTTKFRVTSP